MKYSEAKINRIFVIRLEDKDRLPDVIESFAKEHNILRGMCILVGGIEDGGKIVVGPKDNKKMPPEPMTHILKGVHEVAGIGTIFPDEKDVPRLHMHASLGRKEESRTGCIRTGVNTWQIGEVILFEIVNNSAKRKKDKSTGFELLEI